MRGWTDTHGIHRANGGPSTRDFVGIGPVMTLYCRYNHQLRSGEGSGPAGFEPRDGFHVTPLLKNIYSAGGATPRVPTVGCEGMPRSRRELPRRTVLKTAGASTIALGAGTGVVAAQGRAARAVAYARETNGTDVTEGTVYRLRNKIGSRRRRCNQPPNADGHEGTFFRAGIDGERGSARVLVQSSSLDPLETPVNVKVTKILGKCRRSNLTKVHVQRV